MAPEALAAVLVIAVSLLAASCRLTAVGRLHATTVLLAQLLDMESAFKSHSSTSHLQNLLPLSLNMGGFNAPGLENLV